MKKIFLLLLATTSVFSQSEYPQDYFRNPLDITPILSGTFAELRSNHFHSGIDFKTQQKTGLKVYTAAEGYVSRIKLLIMAMVKHSTLPIQMVIQLFMVI